MFGRVTETRILLVSHCRVTETRILIVSHCRVTETRILLVSHFTVCAVPVQKLAKGKHRQTGLHLHRAVCCSLFTCVRLFPLK